PFSVFGSPEKQHLNCFQESFYNSYIYQEGSCGMNAYKLIKTCFENQIDEVEVLTIACADGLLEPINCRVFTPQSARAGDMTGWGWGFHVVLKHNKYIYDLDFGAEPNVVTAEEYFPKMFNAESRNSLDVITTSGLDYVNWSHRGELTWFWYTHNNVEAVYERMADYWMKSSTLNH
ncbi:MAG: hypothetical protein CL675_14095, partial [Bdellovibrionaceae bacterium]|nr:hypothetical protein [Pseudobdellovibrionaceae bacterium]